MIIGGFPHTTEMNQLSDMIALPSMMGKIQNYASGSFVVRETLPTAFHNTKMPWRKSDCKYVTNEIKIDLIEAIDCILQATSSDTVRSRSLTGKPARQLRSAWTDAWEDASNPDPLPMPLQPRLVREARARIERTSHKSKGAEQLANYFVGQIVGSLNDVKSVRTVIEELVEEYADTMERLDAWAEDADG